MGTNNGYGEISEEAWYKYAFKVQTPLVNQQLSPMQFYLVITAPVLVIFPILQEG